MDQCSLPQAAIRFTYARADFLRLTRRTLWMMWKSFLWQMGACFLLMLMLSFAFSGLAEVYRFLAAVFFSVLCFGLYMVIVAPGYSASIRKDVQIEIGLCEEGILWEADDSTVLYRWPIFTQVAEERDEFMLKRKHGYLLPIPKSSLTDDQLSVIRSLLKKHIAHASFVAYR